MIGGLIGGLIGCLIGGRYYCSWDACSRLEWGFQELRGSLRGMIEVYQYCSWTNQPEMKTVNLAVAIVGKNISTILAKKPENDKLHFDCDIPLGSVDWVALWLGSGSQGLGSRFG